MTKQTQRSSEKLATALLVTATVLSLIPFVNRAFNIDEPLFIWVAKQIQLHPLDFYGFKINWYGTEMAVSDILKNPPLASYYLALVALVTGWGEAPLHLAFMVPAIAAVLGTYALAREFTGNPLMAGLMALANPVFLLSSTTVMCDTMMLAFYVWAVFFWVRGIRTGRSADLLVSSLLTALCGLTKYFGVSLIPLLLVYTLASGKQKTRALFLLIPVLLLSLYQLGTLLSYGRGLLSDAASYASTEREFGIVSAFSGVVIGLSFTGGCLLTGLLFTRRLWSAKGAAAAAAAIACLWIVVRWLNLPLVVKAPSPGYYLQLALFIAAGAGIVGLAGRELWRNNKDADTLLLSLWVLGTFLFASVVNWSVNGRSVLPMVPAAAILAVRLLERRGAAGPEPRQLAVPVCLALALSMAVTWGDYSCADSARGAAKTLGVKYSASGKPLWFQGHWGFQYYLENLGGKPYDANRSIVAASELMVVPEHSTNLFQKVYDQSSTLQVFSCTPSRFVTTMSKKEGAGFYSSRFGGVPFLFGTGGEERYHIVTFDHPLHPEAPPQLAARQLPGGEP